MEHKEFDGQRLANDFLAGIDKRPIKGRHTLATLGSATRLGGEIATASSSMHVKGHRIACVGDIVRYQDGSESRIVSGVLVLFRGNDSYLSRYQDELFEKNPACTWPTFRLTGQFKRRLIYALIFNGDHYDGIYFDANSGVAINTEPSCKTVARETALP
ncbi:PAAR domain-containing protein [Herbaspirillum huttiense]|uniref:PAAR domain-containing protein n=1 Tax=Herbaspirillum huttiense TaxID=863372 RepID=UPI003CEF549B